MNKKKLWGMIGNLVFIALYVPLCMYFCTLGALLLALVSFSWSAPTVFILTAAVIWLCTPILCLVGLVLSLILRKRDRYVFSYIIQLLPFASVLLAILFLLLSALLGNA